MPSEGGDPHLIEGQTNDRPIRLKSPFTPVKLDHLLTWFYPWVFPFCYFRRGLLIWNRISRDPPPLEGLTAILELATFLEMDGARNFAIHHLSSAELGLSASQRISLGLGYRITKWLEPAFRELVLTPACRLTVEDFALLGIPVVHLIMATQASIRCLRLAIAYNPSPTNMILLANALDVNQIGRSHGGRDSLAIIYTQISPPAHTRPWRNSRATQL